MKTNKQTSSNKPIYEIRISNGDSYFLREELDYFLESNELIFIARHKRYNFPTNLKVDFDSFDNWESVERYLSKQGYKHINNVYMYDHSALAFNLCGFSCSWDSGKVGFLASTKKGRKGQKAYKLYSQFLKDLQDYYNNNAKRIELIDENGEQIEFIECFDTRTAEEVAYLKKTFKNAIIKEVNNSDSY